MKYMVEKEVYSLKITIQSNFFFKLNCFGHLLLERREVQVADLLKLPSSCSEESDIDAELQHLLNKSPERSEPTFSPSNLPRRR